MFDINAVHPESRDYIAARKLGKLAGRNWYRVPVRIVHVNTRTLRERTAWCTVDAYSAADAANHVRAEFATVPCVNVYAYGPKGATVHRYVGHESAIWAQMCEARNAGYQCELLDWWQS